MSSKDNSKAFLKSFIRAEPVQVSLPYEDDLYPLLLNEYGIIHLLYHRNLNQHRVTRWWSHLDILHRHTRKILLLLEDVDEIRTLRRLTAIQWNSAKKTFVKVNEFPQMVQKRVLKKASLSSGSRKGKKKRVEKFIMLHRKMSDASAVSLIDKKLSLILKETKYLYKHIIPASYWNFMGVIELAQFANIGFALIGFVSRTWSLLSKVEGFNANAKFQQVLEEGKKKARELARELEEDSKVAQVAEIDFGEVIDVSSLEESVSNNAALSPSPTSVIHRAAEEKHSSEQGKPAKEPSKRKSSNIMDDLFGPSDGTKAKKQKKTKKEKKKKAKSAIDDIFGI